jgi:hypothetical protein
MPPGDDDSTAGRARAGAFPGADAGAVRHHPWMHDRPVEQSASMSQACPSASESASESFQSKRRTRFRPAVLVVGVFFRVDDDGISTKPFLYFFFFSFYIREEAPTNRCFLLNGTPKKKNNHSRAIVRCHTRSTMITDGCVRR